MQDSKIDHKTKTRIARAIGEHRRSPEVERVIERFDWSNMKPVLGNEEAEVLVFEAHSCDHYLYSPTGAFHEYETREVVEDIVPGNPVPDRFLSDSWGYIDPRWRELVRYDCVDDIILSGVSTTPPY